MEFNAFPDLHPNRLFGKTVRRTECIVVAIGAASPAGFPVTVGAGKTGVDRDLLDPSPEPLLKVVREGIEAPSCSPLIWSVY